MGAEPIAPSKDSLLSENVAPQKDKVLWRTSRRRR